MNISNRKCDFKRICHPNFEFAQNVLSIEKGKVTSKDLQNMKTVTMDGGINQAFKIIKCLVTHINNSDFLYNFVNVWTQTYINNFDYMAQL